MKNNSASAAFRPTLRSGTGLRVSRLSSGYGKHVVLLDVDLVVLPGQITAVSGVNGAGKSTLLSTLSGIVPARAGAILFGDCDISALTPPARLRLGISHCPQGRRILQSLTVEENLDLGAWTRSVSESRDLKDWVFEVFPVLHEKRQLLGGTLSGGQQQMLALARSLMSAPSVLLVDEPSMGLAPAVVQEVYGLLRQLVTLDVAVLLVEEHVRLLDQVADEVLLLSGGKLLPADSSALHGDPSAMAKKVLSGADLPSGSGS